MSTNLLTLLSQLTLQELLLRAFYSTLVFIPVYFSCRLLKERLPYLQLTLWSLVLIRAVLPASFSLPFSLRSAIEYLHEDPDAGLGLPLRCITTDACKALPDWVSGTGSLLLVVAWAGASLWFIGRLLRHRRQFRAQLEAALPTQDARLLSLVEQWRTRFRISREVEVRLGDDSAPFTMGCRKPLIYLPRTLAGADLDAAGIVIGHEMAHIKRFDDLWILLCGLTSAVYFFLPPIRHAILRLDLQRERVCDQLVISSGLINASDYAHHLLDACVDSNHHHAVVPGLSAHAAIYTSRCAAIAEAATTGIRGIPAALCTLVGALLFVMPMRPIEPLPRYAFSLNSYTGEAPFIAPIASQHYAALHGETSGLLIRRHVHTGVDFVAPAGTPVVAVADGVVERRESRSYINARDVANSFLVIRHGDYTAYYTYLDQVTVQSGDRVTRGQVVGKLHGSSPTSAQKGAHLHFEVMQSGVSVDPLPLLRRD